MLARSVKARPGNARALKTLGCLLKEVDRSDEAISYPREAVIADPQQRSAFYNLGMMLIENRVSLDEAVEAFGHAASLDGGDKLGRGAPANGLLKQRKPEAALEHIESVLDRAAGDVAALAHKTAALSQLERHAEVDELLDLDSMLRIERFPGGDGFETAAGMNELLVGEILNHPTLAEEKTTVEGLLIAFPSYAWHRTLPFDDPHERICISFNVVPKNSFVPIWLNKPA